MPRSLSNVLLHVIFSTKGRVPFLQDIALRKNLHAYLIGTLRDIGCPSLRDGAWVKIDQKNQCACHLVSSIQNPKSKI
jgi:hypothetical protein